MFLNCFVCIFFTLIASSALEDICPSDMFSHQHYLGTKTPYRVVANNSASEITYEGCQPVKLWAMIRHGTRNPNLQYINKMRTRIPAIRDLILDNLPQATDYIHNIDLNLFQTWKSKLQDKDEKKLTHEGEDEMLFLAERMQQRFPTVLRNIYSESSYQFKYTATQRTKKSAHYFASGLFGRNVVKSIYFPEPLKHDPILRFYKLCSKWQRDVNRNSTILIERNKFINSQIMENTIKEINEKLGFTNELKHSDIHAMYTLCAFETAWNKKKKSPWCSPFSTENLKVMEYSEDLKYYWIDGYGHELTYKQACPASKDMLDFFQDEDETRKSVLYFTHSGTLLKIISHMGLYKDREHLTASTYHNYTKRQWRVSYIDTFASNIVFVLFNCENAKKILTLHQETIVRLPSCPDSDLCDIKKFIKYYRKSVIDCSFDEMCDNLY